MIREIRTAAVFDYPELLEAYAAECSIPLIGQINPQPAMYEAMEQAGILKCFGFFEGHQMVGFANILPTVLPHYGKKVSVYESLYAKRGGKDLMDAVRAYSREIDCTSILYSAPAGGRLERLLSLKKNIVRTNAIFCESLK